jgi:hypothetical protein
MPDSYCRRRVPTLGRTTLVTAQLVTAQRRTRDTASILTATVLMMLATSACTSSESQDDASATVKVSSASASAVATPSAAPTTAAPATTEGKFELAGGATVGVLAEPWTEASRREGQLLQMLPGAPGTNFDDEVWGDIIIYVPDAAYSSGTTDPEPMPADAVAWTTSHADLEILDQREITVDGVAATQIDARATTETNWLAVEAKPYGWGGAERVVLIPHDGSWLVVRGSAFKEDVAFAEEPAPGDAFAAVVDSIDLTG